MQSSQRAACPTIPKAFALNDPRIMDSTGALLLPDIPKALLVIGGGYIGLEIGTVYAALGTKVVVVEFTDGLLPTADRDLVKPLEDRVAQPIRSDPPEYQSCIVASRRKRCVATLEGKDVPAEETFDRVLVSVGRRPNSAGLAPRKGRRQCQ